MKKLLTITILSLLVTVSAFAKTAQVQLITSVAETPVSYYLTYDGDKIEDGTQEYEILVQPLTQDGDTENFKVFASSNMNKDMAISVVVSPETFKTTLNGNEVFDSKIKPSVKTVSSITTLTAGKHDDLVVNKFHMSWNGDEDLPAGNYVSNVKIEYSIL
ncbi:MAG: hypothetical protein ACPKNR_11635 [Pleomorphochaeta sp.]